MNVNLMDQETVGPADRKLYLEFHGRVIEHLGIQMYQSPVNAIAELVANAWDADATSVEIELPESVADPSATFVIGDNGIGMDFDECQNLFLAVGRNRRGDEAEEKTADGRPVLGRKGIGKFAGFRDSASPLPWVTRWTRSNSPCWTPARPPRRVPTEPFTSSRYGVRSSTVWWR